MAPKRDGPKQADSGGPMITGDQKAHFDAFGFLVLRQMLAPDETEVVISEFEAAMLEDRGGRPFDGKKRQIVSDWFRGRPAVQFLMDDRRIHGTAERLLGPDFIFQEGNDGNFYVGDTGWHPDLGWTPIFPRAEATPTGPTGRGTGTTLPASRSGSTSTPFRRTRAACA